MKRVSAFIYTKSTLTFSIIATTVIAVFLWIFFLPAANSFGADGITPLGLSFGLTEDIVSEFYALKSDQMIRAHITFNTYADIIYALFYGSLFSIWISYLYHPLSYKIKLLNLLPFAQTIFDWFENVFLIDMAKSALVGEQVATSSVQLGSLFSICKWIIAGFVFIIIVCGIVYRIYRKLSKNN